MINSTGSTPTATVFVAQTWTRLIRGDMKKDVQGKHCWGQIDRIRLGCDLL